MMLNTSAILRITGNISEETDRDVNPAANVDGQFDNLVHLLQYFIEI